MTYRLIGANQSPYSVKMRAYLRARRIPFVWEWANAQNREETKHVKPPVIPILQHPDGQFQNDSTPLITRLERETSDRPVETDGALGLADLFLEDFGDEWGTKLMAHMRWHNEADREVLSLWVGSELAANGTAEDRAEVAAKFCERQYDRRAVFGSSDANHAFLMHLWERITYALARRLDETPYLLGERPGRADFAWFGQLYQCLHDVTARALILKDSPQIMHWCARMDDLSGIAWPEIDHALPPSPAFLELLSLVGHFHMPLLRAHASAVDAQEEAARVTVDGLTFEQPTFCYHAKCLHALKQAWAAARDDERSALAAYVGMT